MSSMLVTDTVFHGERSWLKDAAPLNMLFMLVVADTSHPEIFWLKFGMLANMYERSAPPIALAMLSLLSTVIEVAGLPLKA